MDICLCCAFALVPAWHGNYIVRALTNCRCVTQRDLGFEAVQFAWQSCIYSQQIGLVFKTGESPLQHMLTAYTVHAGHS